jgi:hypothetical protein
LYEAINTGEIPDQMQQWWSKLKFWIRFCYAGGESLPHKEEYLLHAALANSDTPPLIIELLLAMYPESASLPVNGETQYPLHIAAATPTYQPQGFEMLEDNNVFELLVRAFPEAASVQSPSGLPLDIANAHGKSEEEVRPLIVEGAVRENKVEHMDEEIDSSAASQHDAPDLMEKSATPVGIQRSGKFKMGVRREIRSLRTVSCAGNI